MEIKDFKGQLAELNAQKREAHTSRDGQKPNNHSIYSTAYPFSNSKETWTQSSTMKSKNMPIQLNPLLDSLDAFRGDMSMTPDVRSFTNSNYFTYQGRVIDITNDS